MKLLQLVTFPHKEFNEAVLDGTAGEKMNRILETIQPEHVYFTEQDGKRGAVMIIDLSDPSEIPALSEPWFLTFNADVHFRIAMSPADLQKAGLEELGKKWA